jgi:hypothetical protein
MVLAKASAHDGHDEPRDPRVEEQVSWRHDDADRLRQRDRVSEQCEHVIGRCDVVPPIGDGDVMPAGDPDRGLTHRHPSVRQGDREVQREAGSHQECGRREPAIHRNEPQEAGVRGRNDSAGEPPGRRQRDALCCKAKERRPPPVKLNLFEPAEASTEQEAGADRGEQDQDDEGHDEVRSILPPFRDRVQGDRRVLDTL